MASSIASHRFQDWGATFTWGHDPIRQICGKTVETLVISYVNERKDYWLNDYWHVRLSFGFQSFQIKYRYTQDVYHNRMYNTCSLSLYIHIHDIIHLPYVYPTICFLCIFRCEKTFLESGTVFAMEKTEVGMRSLTEASGGRGFPRAGRRFQLPTLPPKKPTKIDTCRCFLHDFFFWNDGVMECKLFFCFCSVMWRIYSWFLQSTRWNADVKTCFSQRFWNSKR